MGHHLPRRISTRAYLMLRAIAVFNALLLVLVAVLLWIGMEHPAGIIAAAACCLLAGMCLGAARHLDNHYRRAGG